MNDVATAPQIDIYSHERGSLIETMAVLAGRSTWREPAGSFTRARDPMPWEHVLEMAIAWHRGHADSDDMSGDVLHGVAVMHMPQSVEDRCVRRLAVALCDMSRMCRAMPEGRLLACTRSILRQCVTGRRMPYPPRSKRAERGFFDAFGARIVWAQAERGLARVAAALA